MHVEAQDRIWNISNVCSGVVDNPTLPPESGDHHVVLGLWSLYLCPKHVAVYQTCLCTYGLTLIHFKSKHTGRLSHCKDNQNPSNCRCTSGHRPSLTRDYNYIRKIINYNINDVPSLPSQILKNSTSNLNKTLTPLNPVYPSLWGWAATLGSTWDRSVWSCRALQPWRISSWIEHRERGNCWVMRFWRERYLAETSLQPPYLCSVIINMPVITTLLDTRLFVTSGFYVLTPSAPVIS